MNLTFPKEGVMKELNEWLNENVEHFKGYSLDEVEKAAVAVGFDRWVVKQWKDRQRFLSFRKVA